MAGAPHQPARPEQLRNFADEPCIEVKASHTSPDQGTSCEQPDVRRRTRVQDRAMGSHTFPLRRRGRVNTHPPKRQAHAAPTRAPRQPPLRSGHPEGPTTRAAETGPWARTICAATHGVQRRNTNEFLRDNKARHPSLDAHAAKSRDGVARLTRQIRDSANAQSRPVLIPDVCKIPTLTLEAVSAPGTKAGVCQFKPHQ